MQLPNGSHNFFFIFSIFFKNCLIKKPQTTNALPFLTHLILNIGGVSCLMPPAIRYSQGDPKRPPTYRYFFLFGKLVLFIRRNADRPHFEYPADQNAVSKLHFFLVLMKTIKNLQLID